MKKIGLVGGTGPESTLAYYKKLNEEIDSVEIHLRKLVELVLEN